MKLKIEINFDNEGPINERCKSVNFCPNWAKITPDEAIYFIGLLKADLEFADGIFHEKENGVAV